MANENPKLKAEIITTFDGRGAAEAKKSVAEQIKGFDQLSETAQRTLRGEAIETEKVISRKQQLRAAVKGLAFEFPVLARFAHLALNPISLALGGIVIVAERFRASLVRLQEQLAPGGTFASTTKAWEAQIDAIKQTDLEALAYQRSLLGIINNAEQFGRISAALLANLTGQSKALDAIEEAQKKLALSTASSAEEREQIEVTFANRRMARLNKEADEAVAIKKRERERIREEITKLDQEAQQIEDQLRGAERPGLAQARFEAAKANVVAAQEQVRKSEQALAGRGVGITAALAEPLLRQKLESDRAALAQAEANLRAQEGTVFERQDTFNQIMERRALNRQLRQQAGARESSLGQEIEQSLITGGIEKDTRASVAEIERRRREVEAVEPAARRGIEINQQALQQAGYQVAENLSVAIDQAIQEVFVNGVAPQVRKMIEERALKLAQEINRKIEYSLPK